MKIIYERLIGNGCIEGIRSNPSKIKEIFNLVDIDRENIEHNINKEFQVYDVSIDDHGIHTLLQNKQLKVLF